MKRQLTDRNFHAFRKTLASNLFANGVQGEVIDKIFGWATPGIRARYYVDVNVALLHAAIKRTYADDPL